LVYDNQATIYAAGSKQTFKASATLAGLSFDGGVVTDPTTLVSGDTWFNTTANHLKFFDGTTTKTLAFTTDIAAGTVTTSTTLTSGQLIVGAGGSIVGVGNLTGDITTSGGTATTLAGTVGGTHTFSGNVSFTNAASTFAGNAATATTAGNVTGTVGIGNGGTGLSLASVAAGSYLRGTGTTFAVSPIQAADVPSLSGTYVDLTSTQTIAGTKTFNSTPVFGTAGGSGGFLIPPTATGSQKNSFPLDMEATNAGNLLHLFRIVALDGTTPKWDFQFCNNNTPCTPVATGFSIASTGAITATNSLSLAGSTSGTATIAAQAAAGTPTLTLPNANGTFAVSAQSPLVLNTTTGNLTCPTCGTGSGTVTSVTASSPLASTGGTTPNISLTGTVAIANGGTGATTASTARTNLGAAASAANSDITSLTALTSVTSSVNFSNASSTFAGNAATATTATTAASATTAGTATTATNANNLNAGATVSGSTTWTNVSAPATPAAGKLAVYADSTNKQLCAKDDTGAVSCAASGGGSSSVFTSTGTTPQTGVKFVHGNGTLNAGGNLTVTFGTSFTSATSFDCNASDASNTPALIGVQNQTANSIKINGTGGHAVSFVCVGV
jgi:hypothetical protein